MRSGRRVLPLVLLLGALAAATAAFAGTVSWGSAIEVPGTAALNVGGFAGVSAISCSSAGNCTAGGSYADGETDPLFGDPGDQAFVVSEQGGVWGTAIEVPGLAALNTGAAADVNTVSCASAGNCAVSGHYWATCDHGQAICLQGFVVSEQGGVWGTATQAPGVATLSPSKQGWVNSVSCGGPGDCTAGGIYSAHRGFRAFLVSEKDGTWGKAFPVGGIVAHRHQTADVGTVSCAGVGDCVAVGAYTNGAGELQPFVVTETNGVWGKKKNVPGGAALSVGGSAWLDSVSCSSPGNCAATGRFLYGADGSWYYPFLVSEKNGRWGTARPLWGRPVRPWADVSLALPVSCGSAGDCVAGGEYVDRAGNLQAFVVSKTNGRWSRPIDVPGLAGRGPAAVTSVSCASAGNCAVTGFYADGTQAFVVAEWNGVWGAAEKVPGTANLGVGSSAGSISCVSAGNCAIGGISYPDWASGTAEPFVTAP
jgi:hypothetical protein